MITEILFMVCVMFIIGFFINLLNFMTFKHAFVEKISNYFVILGLFILLLVLLGVFIQILYTFIMEGPI